MAMSLFFLGVAILVIGTVESTCDDGWVVYGGSCYQFPAQKHSFLDAEAACKHHNSHLVHINDAAENGFLKNFCLNLKVESRWTGLTDEALENAWLWYDTDERAVFTDWGPGEPNESTGGNCMALYKSSNSNYQWADGRCNVPLQYICEKEQESLIAS